MKRFGQYIIVNSKEELYNTGYRVIWEDDKINAIRIMHYGVFYGVNKPYPHYYKYEVPFDLHECGVWHICDKAEVIDYLNRATKSKTKEIAEIQNTIKALEED